MDHLLGYTIWPFGGICPHNQGLGGINSCLEMNLSFPVPPNGLLPSSQLGKQPGSTIRIISTYMPAGNTRQELQVFLRLLELMEKSVCIGKMF